MKKFQFSKELETTPERSWEIFFDNDFNKQLCEKLNHKSMTLVGLEDDARRLKISRKYITNGEVPPAIQRMTDATELGYTTEETFDKRRKMMKWTFVPNIFDDGVEGSGTITVEAIPGGRIRRTFKGVIEADLPFIGEQLEERMVSVIGESFEKGMDILQEFIERDKEDAAAGRELRTLTPPSADDVVSE